MLYILQKTQLRKIFQLKIHRGIWNYGAESKCSPSRYEQFASNSFHFISYLSEFVFHVGIVLMAEQMRVIDSYFSDILRYTI